MGKLYAFLALSFIFLFVINIIFVSLTIYAWVTDGIQDLLIGMELGERIESSNQIKWIILADITWLFFALVFLLKRKHYRTNSSDYLSSNIIKKRKITVVIPAYNEENNVESIITDYKSQKNVENIIVVDNHSSDNTVQIAKKMGAIIVEKESNKGFADSCLMGLKKSLETDANIIVLTECDGTYAGHDIEKLVPFLDECDVAIGSRLIQVLTEKGNQNHK